MFITQPLPSFSLWKNEPLLPSSRRYGRRLGSYRGVDNLVKVGGARLEMVHATPEKFWTILNFCVTASIGMHTVG